MTHRFIECLAGEHISKDVTIYATHNGRVVVCTVIAVTLKIVAKGLFDWHG